MVQKLQFLFNKLLIYFFTSDSVSFHIMFTETQHKKYNVILTEEMSFRTMSNSFSLAS